MFQKKWIKKYILANLKDEDPNFNSTITPFNYVVDLEFFSS